MDDSDLWGPGGFLEGFQHPLVGRDIGFGLLFPLKEDDLEALSLLVVSNGLKHLD